MPDFGDQLVADAGGVPFSQGAVFGFMMLPLAHMDISRDQPTRLVLVSGQLAPLSTASVDKC